MKKKERKKLKAQTELQTVTEELQEDLYFPQKTLFSIQCHITGEYPEWWTNENRYQKKEVDL